MRQERINVKERWEKGEEEGRDAPGEDQCQGKVGDGIIYREKGEEQGGGDQCERKVGDVSFTDHEIEEYFVS